MNKRRKEFQHALFVAKIFSSRPHTIGSMLFNGAVGLNMLSFKSVNDDEEFYRAVGRFNP